MCILFLDKSTAFYVRIWQLYRFIEVSENNKKIQRLLNTANISINLKNVKYRIKKHNERITNNALMKRNYMSKDTG